METKADTLKDIPKGKYCKGCKYNRIITQKTVNMFGDDSGYIEKYYCALFNCELDNNYHYFAFIDKLIEPNTKCFECSLKTEEFNEGN